jgi:hypothetical protein
LAGEAKAFPEPISDSKIIVLLSRTKLKPRFVKKVLRPEKKVKKIAGYGQGPVRTKKRAGSCEPARQRWVNSL